MITQLLLKMFLSKVILKSILNKIQKIPYFKKGKAEVKQNPVCCGYTTTDNPG